MDWLPNTKGTPGGAQVPFLYNQATNADINDELWRHVHRVNEAEAALVKEMLRSWVSELDPTVLRKRVPYYGRLMPLSTTTPVAGLGYGSKVVVHLPSGAYESANFQEDQSNYPDGED